MREWIRTGEQLRAALADLGLSQTGFAQVLKRRGYDTNEATILRNIQNAVEPGARVNQHLAHSVDLLISHRDLRRRNKRDLEWLENGGRLQSNDGSGWVDQTEEQKHTLRRYIAELDALLPGVPP